MCAELFPETKNRWSKSERDALESAGHVHEMYDNRLTKNAAREQGMHYHHELNEING